MSRLCVITAIDVLGPTDAVAPRPEVRDHFLRALELGGESRQLRARVEQYHKLGMTSLDRREDDAAERYFQQSCEIARRVGDAYLEGLCLVNHAKVQVRAVVREWGQSIESADTYTFGHCERVARRAVAVAEAMGLDEHAQTTVRVGAYLHDVGKVRVPHEILNKPDQLTSEECEVVQMHPVWGIDLLSAVEFPWDIKPVIHWHHERYDGSGYPDRLRGDEIPLSAQIVGIADVYDALTTTRPYRPALPLERALAEMDRCRGWWSGAVRAAFRKSLAPPQSHVRELLAFATQPHPVLALSA